MILNRAQVKRLDEALISTGGICPPVPSYWEALAARPDVRNLAMIAVYPSAEEQGELVIDGGVDADTIHCTMVFLGDANEIDLKAAARAVGSVSGSTKPLSGAISGVGLFAAGDDGYPQLAIPGVNGLAQLRTDLVAALAEENIASPSEHDWVPHITLSYVDDPELPDVDAIGKSVTFDQLSLVVSDERKDFPFDPDGSADDVHRGSMSRAFIRRREILKNAARHALEV